MDTKITIENPFDYGRYGFAWEHVPGNGSGHLDLGCYHGVFLDGLKKKGIDRLVGVDISADATSKACASFGDLEFIHVSDSSCLPFADGVFTSVSAMDVIEHANEQRKVLNELSRVLKDDGLLIVTVPRRHIFSFLDSGNLKFRFPGLHRRYYCLRHTEAEYKDRYDSNSDGLVGDISAEKGWHEHFSQAHLEKLLNDCGFVVECFDGSGLFSRIISYANLISRKLRLLQPLVDKVFVFDSRHFKSANLFCVARKTSNRDQTI